ncbi:hypothetical protein AMR41_00845 [Hapalosiphon sp. MRB220]|nr:hypothetical protein AMR41_00845 [Hapalosiphon sp. MRB220]
MPIPSLPNNVLVRPCLLQELGKGDWGSGIRDKEDKGDKGGGSRENNQCLMLDAPCQCPMPNAQ